MQGRSKQLWRGIIGSLALATLGFAQTNVNVPANQSGSVLPGAVNYVEGQVSLNGENLPSSSSLRSTVLQPNGVLDTGKGYAEVLLTPGAFLRLGHDSEVRLVSAGLVETKVALLRGSAMVEAAEVVKGADVEIDVNGVQARIEDKGLYSFDAGAQTVKVLDGKLRVIGQSGSSTLKKGDQILLSSDNPLKKRDFNKKAAEADPLFVWSKVRSEDESQANISAANRIATYGGWNGPGWYWDTAWDSYAFMPGYGILGSPFGWRYYSPAFVYAAPYGFAGRGYLGRGYYGQRAYYGRSFRGGIGRSHTMTGVRSMGAGGFHGSAGFNGGGFHAGGGVHGGGGHR